MWIGGQDEALRDEVDRWLGARHRPTQHAVSTVADRLQMPADIAAAISEYAHISLVTAARLVTAIERGLVPGLRIVEGD